MWIIAGLGNPGRRYRKTRHNLGFEVVDLLAKILNLSFFERDEYTESEGVYRDIKLVLVKPLTYMNLSGIAIRKVLKEKKVPPERLIVIHDDLDLPPGRIKIKKGGSSGGHKGIKSIIEHISTGDFIRIKVGIGRPVGAPLEGYVLEKIPSEERTLIEEAVQKAADAALCIITDGLEKTMSRFNRRD